VAARREDDMAEEATVVTDIHTFQQQQHQQAAGYPPNASGNWPGPASAGSAPAWGRGHDPRAAQSGGWQAQQQIRPSTGQSPAMIAVPRAQPEKRGIGGLQIALLVLVVLAFVGVAGLGVRFLLMSGDSEAPDGSVAFMTTPPGATIEIDGETWSEVTPAVVGGLEIGRAYAVTLSLEGHEAVRDSITLESDRALQQSWDLEALTGTITVASQPPGAIISIDGGEQGEAPSTIEDLDMSRTYTVTASLDGYEPVTRTIRWDAEGPREQNIAITLAPMLDEAIAEVDAPDEQPQAAATTTRSATSAQLAATPRPSASRPSASAPSGSRPSGSRPSAGAPTGSRPSATASAPSGSRPSGSRPGAGAPTGSRPSAGAPTGSRPSAGAPTGSRPSAGAPTGSRPSGSRPSGSRPSTNAPTAPAAAPAATGGGYISVQAVPFGQVWINNRMVAPETPLMNHALPAGVHQVKVYFTPIRQFSDERTVRVEPGSSRTLTFHAPR
jgi:hypothetical protein